MICPTCHRPCVARREGYTLVAFCEPCTLGATAQACVSLRVEAKPPRRRDLPRISKEESRQRREVAAQMDAWTKREWEQLLRERSPRAIADLLGVTDHLVRLRMRDKGVSVPRFRHLLLLRREGYLPPKNERFPKLTRPPRYELRTTYETLGSVKAVADHYGVSDRCLRIWMEELDLTPRAHGGPRPCYTGPSAEVLERLYGELGTVAAVAQHLGQDLSRTYKQLRRFSIPLARRGRPARAA